MDAGACSLPTLDVGEDRQDCAFAYILKAGDGRAREREGKVRSRSLGIKFIGSSKEELKRRVSTKHREESCREIEGACPSLAGVRRSSVPLVLLYIHPAAPAFQSGNTLSTS